MMHIWKTLKVFISSTFKDLEKERDRIASVFRQIQESIFAQRLHLIPYDLRWQEQNEKDLVHWCLNMVGQVDYFIGILGYRYGWRPPQDDCGHDNLERLSITEMEIRKALKIIPKSRRFFCFGDWSQYSPSQLSSETEEDRKSLAMLKNMLESQGEKIFFYRDSEQALQRIRQELEQTIREDYPAGQKAELESYKVQEALAEIIAEKCKGFVGRGKYLEEIYRFAQERNFPNWLVVHAVAGTGKSSLLAQFFQTWKAKHPEIPIVAHYMSMAGSNRSVRGILQSIGEQLKTIGRITDELEVLPEKLSLQLRSALQSQEMPLVLLVDGLDESEEDAQELTWIPSSMPPHVRVVLSTRPVAVWEKIRHNSHVVNLELPPLEDMEIREIIQDYQKRHDLRLTVEEQGFLAQRAAGNPLFLKVALDEMARGGLAVGQLATTVEALFHQILQRLAATVGEDAIHHYLGLIAAAHNGLTEAELREIIHEDYPITATQDFFALVSRALANFVIQREKMLGFFHPEFERSVKMLLGKGGMRGYHKRLSLYFTPKWHSYERALLELPYQLQSAEQYEPLLRILSDIEFLQTKASAGMTIELRQDFQYALEAREVPLPSNLSVSLAPQVDVNKALLAWMARILDLDFNFLLRHPQFLFQSLWNQGYWHDCPEAALHYQEESSLPQEESARSTSSREESARSASSREEPARRQQESTSRPGESARSSDESVRPSDEPVRPSDESASRPENPVYRPKASFASAPWNLPGPKLYRLVEYWRTTWNERPWIKTMRPLPERLDSPLVKIFRGHEDFATAVCFTPDGRKILSGGYDKAVRIWDVYTGECVGVFSGHEDYISCMDVTSNGKLIASGSGDGSIRIWDVQNGNCLQIMHEHKKAVATLKFTPDGQKLLSAGKDKVIRVWDCRNWQVIRCLKGHENLVNGLDVAHDGKTIVSCAWDNTVRMWNLETGECVRTSEGHEGHVRSVAISPDGKTVLSGADDHTLRVWDSNGECVAVLPHDSIVFSVAFSYDGRKIVSGDYGVISLWDATSFQCELAVRGHESSIFNLAISPDNRHVISCSSDKTIRMWDIRSSGLALQLASHDKIIYSFNLSENGNKAITASRDNSLMVWDTMTGKRLLILNGHEDHVRSGCFTDHDRMIVSGADDKSVKVWDASNGVCIRQMSGHDKNVTSVFPSHDGRWFVSGNRDGMIRLWESTSGKCILQLSGHDKDVRSLYLTTDGMKIISGGEDRTVRIWDVGERICLKVLTGHKEGITSVAMSQDGRLVYSTSRDNQFRVWDVNTSECQIFSGTGNMSQWTLPETTLPDYVLSQDWETAVFHRATNQPWLFFPSVLRNANLHPGGILGGYAGVHVYLLQLQKGK